MSDTLITRAELEAVFDSLDIKQGSVILLQADLQNCHSLVGGETTLIESLTARIGPKGLLIVPAFTMQALDPACADQSNSERNEFPGYEDWKIIREEHPGFSSKTMPPDTWKEAANAMLLHTRVKRSEHPVYSFAWMGNAVYSPSLESLDFPISFSHILSEMKKKQAMNLLVNVDIDEALLFEMTAREMEEDVISVKKACVRRVKKTFEESFLHGTCDRQAMISAMQNLEIVRRVLKGITFYRVTQKADS